MWTVTFPRHSNIAVRNVETSSLDFTRIYWHIFTNNCIPARNKYSIFLLLSLLEDYKGKWKSTENWPFRLLGELWSHSGHNINLALPSLCLNFICYCFFYHHHCLPSIIAFLLAFPFIPWLFPSDFFLSNSLCVHIVLNERLYLDCLVTGSQRVYLQSRILVSSPLVDY